MLNGFMLGVLVMLLIDWIHDKSTEKNITEYMSKVNDLLKIIVEKLKDD
jgi:hypothetical protein